MNLDDKEKALKVASRYLGLNLSSEPPKGLISKATGEVVGNKSLSNSE